VCVCVCVCVCVGGWVEGKVCAVVVVFCSVEGVGNKVRTWCTPGLAC